jgi:hypothetical protein
MLFKCSPLTSNDISCSFPDFSKLKTRVLRIIPRNKLLMGSLAGKFKDKKKADQYLKEANILAPGVSGKIVSGEIIEAKLVKNPAKVLRSLKGNVRIVSGEILAGPETNIQILTDEDVAEHVSISSSFLTSSFFVMKVFVRLAFLHLQLVLVFS